VASLKKLVDATLELRERGIFFTHLGVCPMSEELIRVPIELAHAHGFPLLFVASRNQISEDKGGGYVMGLDPRRFVEMIEDIEKSVRGATGNDGKNYLRFVSVDHCGPWYKEHEKSMGLEDAVASVRRTLSACIEAGYEGIHIDCTFKPPVGVEMDEDGIIQLTADLFEFTESERKRLGKPEVGYEIGTEESSGAGVTAAHFRISIGKILDELKKRNLPLPAFAVGRTGAKLEMLENTGGFDYTAAHELPAVAAGFGIGFKEHNADYLSTPILSIHPHYGITAANVGPAFAVAQTQALLELAAMEEGALGDKASGLYAAMSNAALEKAPFHKWLRKGDDWTVEELRTRPAELRAVTLATGHYVYYDPLVKETTERLFENLKAHGILADPQGYVDSAVSAAIMRYVDAMNLRGSTQKILEAI